MDNKQIVILLPIICLGIITILAGILIRIRTVKRNNSCTKKTIGHVVKYVFPGGSKMYPVVEFEVGGQSYLTKKKFNAIKSLEIGFPFSRKSEAYEDDKGNLCVKTGPIANLKNLAENLWPIGKEMTVYYNSQNPNINFVERPITNNFLTIMSIIMGTLMVLISVGLYFII